MKQIIVTADDFGINDDVNIAIYEASKCGILTDTCIMANGNSFDNAVQIAKENKNFIKIGVHLNIIEGKSFVFESKSPLTNELGEYNLSFIQMLLKSLFDKSFLDAVEKEFRAQIERVLEKGITPDKINSHVHIHSIPKIFEIVSKLAKEYDIEYVRTQGEIFYTTGEIKRHLNKKYFLNIIKNILLNFFTLINKKILKKYNLKTNGYFIGVLYTGNMDKQTIEAGLKALPSDCSAEIILHPAVDEKRKNNYVEFQTLRDENLKSFLN